MRTAILGLGHYLPSPVPSAGVNRPIAVEPVGPSVLAAKATSEALARAHLSVDGIEFIIFATMTPDVTFPGAGCFFQHVLECGTVGALDIRAQCAGFVFGLAIADQFLRAGVYTNVVLAGAEVHSSGLDYSEAGASIARLYGDGAGVAVLGGAQGSEGLLGIAIHTDGRQHKRFWYEYPSSRQHPVRMTVENFRQGLHFPTIDLDAVRDFGIRSLPDVIHEALAAATLKLEQVDCYIIGHVLPEVAETVGKRLGLAASRVNVPAARYGHLTAAALPVALSEEVSAGRLGPGATVCLATAGAGFAWGAAVVRL
jgi:3-oxoacyl-[acyl-carrier-protein] synthase-3